MTSFSLPGRGGSILNDSRDAGPSSRSGSGPAQAARDAAGNPRAGKEGAGSSNTGTEKPAFAAGTLDGGTHRNSNPVSRSWRRHAAAAAVADAAVGAGATESRQVAASTMPPLHRVGSGGDSTDVTPPSTGSGSGSEDSTGSYFKKADIARLEASSRGDSTSVTSFATSSFGGSEASLKPPVDRRERSSFGSMDGDKVLSEPGLVASPAPVGTSSGDLSPVPPRHNGPGGAGSSVDSLGVTAKVAEETARSARTASQRKSARDKSSTVDDQGDTNMDDGPANARGRGISRQAYEGASSSSSSLVPSSAASPAPPAKSTQPLTIGGKKRYPCAHPGCEKTFSTSGHAARHHRIHSGHKPYRCTFPGCKASFSRQDNSLQHYRTHVLHPKGRNAAAVASSLDDENGGDLSMLHLDPETEASVQLGRKALQEGTAIAVVQEVVNEDGRREEAVQRTVGMPRSRRDSTRSDQLNEADIADEYAVDSASRLRSDSISVSAYSPPSSGEMPHRAAANRSSAPQLPHLSAAVYGPPALPLPAQVHDYGVPGMSAPPPQYATHRYAPYAAPAHLVAPQVMREHAMPRVSTNGLTGVSGLIGATSGEDQKQRWMNSPLDLLPSHWRSSGAPPEPATSAPSMYAEHRRSLSSGSGKFEHDSMVRQREHSAASISAAAHTFAPTGPSAISRLPSASGSPPYPAMMQKMAPALPVPHSHPRTTMMRLSGPLPSLTQLPCSSDRSTSGQTPTTPLDSPGFAVKPSGTSSARRETVKLPPLRSFPDRR